MGSERVNRSFPHRLYTDIFYEQFPFYLSIGMTEEQYWDRDCELVRYYRKAEKLRTDKLNQQAWLQGMYVYDAISRLTPVLHAFAKKGTKAKPYVDAPYPVSKRAEKSAKERKGKEVSRKGLAYMQAYMVRNNQKFGERK